MRCLLDTSVAILLRDADTDADRRLGELDSVPALSVISQVELEGGVHAHANLAVKRRAALDVLLAAFPILPFDAGCVAAYRGIVETVGYSKRKVIDRMIAATALVHGLRMITLNGADFADVPGLDLEVWPTP